MKKRLISFFLILLLLFSLIPQAFAESGLYPDFTKGYADITAAQTRAREWFNSLSAPFSFELDRVKSETFLDTWSVHSMDAVDDDGHTHRTIVYTNPENTLEMRLEAILYADVPTVEWVMYFHNTGTENSPVIRRWMGLDVVFPSAETDLMTTNGAMNMDQDEEDYLPLRYTMIPGGANDSLSFTPAQARSSHVAWPFFNLRFDSQDGGVMLAIGWTGQWTASFDQTADGLHVRSGMGTLNTMLYPDEEIRTPSYSITFYDGNENDGQNMLRRVMLSHYTPVKENDENRLTAPLSTGSWGGRNERHMLSVISNFTDANIPVDTVWMDAGWFGDHPDTNVTGQDEWYEWTGDWFENPNLFPNGLSAIGQAAEEKGLNFLLWLEPERCHKTSSFYLEHKDWCYKGIVNGSAVVNFGNPDCLAWWIDYACNLIDETGLDVWRQDFNIDPGPLWRQADSNNRRGISEIRHIEGLYAFWDALLAHKPSLLIDNCASGGRRLDFEALKRSIPLWSSDYYCGPSVDCTPEGAQSLVSSLSYWLPIFGTGFGGNSPANPYIFRSFLAPSMQIPDDTAYRVGDMVNQAAQARFLMYGDFYPLAEPTPYGQVWQAREYFRPDLQEGMLLAFRRRTEENQATFKLSGLDPEASYAFDDADSKYDTPAVYTGKQLMEEGLTITLGTEKSAMYFFSQVD